MRDMYRAQVDLLLQVIPFIAKEKSFALKGGTAINLFVYDMPRLSVDIDLTYIGFEERTVALKAITAGLSQIKTQLMSAIPGIRVTAQHKQGEDEKLVCTTANATIKIEVNTTIRGYLFPTRLMQLTPKVQDMFQKFAAMNVVSHGELFGGKLCAALDRQHPRDLFDVHQLFHINGFNEEVKHGFIASLLSHSRPLHEVLAPNVQDHRKTFEQKFKGMSLLPFSYEDHKQTHAKLITTIRRMLNDDDKQLLLSFAKGEPDWTASPMVDLQRMPAVRWKLQNIQSLSQKDPQKYRLMIEKLDAVLSAA